MDVTTAKDDVYSLHMYVIAGKDSPRAKTGQLRNLNEPQNIQKPIFKHLFGDSS